MKDNNKEIIQNSTRRNHSTFVIIWLIILIIAALVTAFLSYESFQGTNGIIIGALSAINVILLLIILLKYKIIGFYGYLVSKLIIIGIIISMGHSQIIGNIVGLFVLYLILQIKSKINGKTSWEQLE